MPKDENLNDSMASANGGLAGSSEIGMNESGTSGKSGTYLTQAGSGFDLENTRRKLPSDLPPRTVADCRDPDSCFRHKECMYLGCSAFGINRK